MTTCIGLQRPSLRAIITFRGPLAAALLLSPEILRAQASAAPAPPVPVAVASPSPTFTPTPTPLPLPDRANHRVLPFLKETGPPKQDFVIVKNWTFGNRRPDATVRNRTELDDEFYYRYIYEQGKLNKLSTYWSEHRDYPDGDPKSLHVFGPNTLTLKGRIPPNGGLRDRGLETGILRGKIPITEGMYIEMRAKVPRGVGTWPAFWLNAGVQYPDGTFSKLPWPPEIDIFEFFNWNGRPKSRIMECNIQTNSQPAKFGNPRTIWESPKFEKNYPDKGFDTGVDCGENFHVYALDWRKNEPIWLFDGQPIKQVYYEWNGPPAHVLITNQLGMMLPGVKTSEMKADEKNWDFVVDYIRVWERKPRRE